MSKKLVLIIMVLYVFSFAEEKIVQNGLSGYTGCIDAYLTEAGKDDGSPHGTEDKLRLRGGT